MPKTFELKFDLESPDRDTWNEAWASQPVRQLGLPVHVDVGPSRSPLHSVSISLVPLAFAAMSWRKSPSCPCCGLTTESTPRLAASLLARFENEPSTMLGVWVHEACWERCPNLPGPAPIPW